MTNKKQDTRTTYRVGFERTEWGSCTVKAISPEEARVKAFAEYEKGNVEWNKDEYDIDGIIEE